MQVPLRVRPCPRPPPHMHLVEIVETSRRVAAARGRLEKIGHLAACLGRVDRDSVEIAVAYLAGELPQGSIGVGPALVREAMAGNAAAEPSLTLRKVDEALTRVAQAAGPGSGAERRRVLGALFARATRDEQELLARLLLGELRQGALAGLVVEALARAAGVEPARVRRALQVETDLALIRQNSHAA